MQEENEGTEMATVQPLKQTCASLAKEVEQIQRQLREHNLAFPNITLGTTSIENDTVPTHDITAVIRKVRSSITLAYDRLTEEIIRIQERCTREMEDNQNQWVDVVTD